VSRTLSTSHGSLQSSKQADTIGINRLAVDTAPKIETPFRDLAIAADLPFRVKGRSASNLFLKDRCAFPDQMSFVPPFPWGRLVLAVGYRDCFDKNEIAVFVFSVTAKDFPHEMLPLELSPVYLTFFPPLGHTTPHISVLSNGS
jgi:hypothetical protein